MDSETKRRIQAAAKSTPRYLFRCWSNADRPTGGHKDLNTTTAITPLAFSKYGNGGAPSLYHLSPEVLVAMAASHLEGEDVNTQISSWTASLRVAFDFAQWNSSPCYVSIIDTKRLPNNMVLHVPCIAFLTDELAAFDSYDHEYLAHGNIQGPAHRAVPLWAFKEVTPYYFGTAIPRSHMPGPAPEDGYSSISHQEVRTLGGLVRVRRQFRCSSHHSNTLPGAAAS